MRPQAVLFDAVGTLFHVRGSVGDVYATVARRHGVGIAPEVLEQRFAGVFRGMPPLCFPAASAEELEGRERDWWKTVVAGAFAGASFADFDAFFTDLFAHFAAPAAWEIYPEVGPVLEELRGRDVRLAIVSNFDGRLLSVCDGLELTPRVDAIVMSSRAGFAKPDPRIFQVALAQLQTVPSDALHVGDSEVEDFDGARRAGLDAVLVDRAAERPRWPTRITNLGQILENVPG